jgi:ethanolamine ammonia-lyase small subunit
VNAGPDPWGSLQRWSPARIALGRAGGSLPTKPLLEFQLAHSRARDAVLREADLEALAASLREAGLPVVMTESRAPSRAAYVERPDLGRRLSDESRARLEAERGDYDCVFVVGDGLSGMAAERHALPVLGRAWPKLKEGGWALAPVVVARNARVALSDEAGAALGASLAVILIGERPGLTAPDSLGIYLTWQPAPGRADAERNCISNIRPEGLGYASAVHRLLYLMQEARRRELSGVDLKEAAPALGAAALEQLYPGPRGSERFEH